MESRKSAYLVIILKYYLVIKKVNYNYEASKIMKLLLTFNKILKFMAKVKTGKFTGLLMILLNYLILKIYEISKIKSL